MCVKVPIFWRGSDVLCLGNSDFWKFSRPLRDNPSELLEEVLKKVHQEQQLPSHSQCHPGLVYTIGPFSDHHSTWTYKHYLAREIGRVLFISIHFQVPFWMHNFSTAKPCLTTTAVLFHGWSVIAHLETALLGLPQRNAGFIPGYASLLPRALKSFILWVTEFQSHQQVSFPVHEVEVVAPQPNLTHFLVPCPHYLGLTHLFLEIVILHPHRLMCL